MRTTETKEIRKEIGEDLWRLTDNLGLRIAGIERLTTLFSEHLPRGSFKLTLDDGRVVKARCFQSETEAGNVNRLSRLLGREYFPRVFASHGRGLLSEWIEGSPLSCRKIDEGIFRKSGVIQGVMHSSPLPESLYERLYSDSDYWQRRLEKKLNYLVENGCFTEAEEEHLRKIARQDLPGNLAVGLIHGDFCAENMILNKKEKLSVIDIELISVTALAYDLARTAIRWPMNARQRKAYLSGYRKFKSPDEFLENFSFWIILVLAEAAIFFAQGKLAQLKEGLDKLREALCFSGPQELIKSYGFPTI